MTWTILFLVILIGWPVAAWLKRRRVARERAAVRMEARGGCILVGVRDGVWHRWDGKEWTTAPFGVTREHDPHAEPWGDA